jgi:hypothetical protein
MQADFASHQQHGHLQQAYDGLQARIESLIASERFQELVQVAMQQWLAAASCFAALMLLLATIAAGMLHAC